MIFWRSKLYLVKAWFHDMQHFITVTGKQAYASSLDVPPSADHVVAEQDVDLSLRLSNVHVDELRTLHTEEVDAALCCHCLCHKSLPRAYTHECCVSLNAS